MEKINQININKSNIDIFYLYDTKENKIEVDLNNIKNQILNAQKIQVSNIKYDILKVLKYDGNKILIESEHLGKIVTLEINIFFTKFQKLSNTIKNKIKRIKNKL